MKIKLLTGAVFVLAATIALQAGGFWLETGNPQASPEARAANAVLVIRAIGCHNPAEADVTGTAIGIVDGKRVSKPLKLVKLSTPGAYAVARQWPAEGPWALQFVATTGDLVTSAIMPANGDDVPRHEAKYAPGPPNPDQVNAILTAQR